MPVEKRFEIKINEDGLWQVHADEGLLPVASYPSKEQAVARGREIAKGVGNSRLIIRRADGTIDSEMTFEREPYPPAG